LVVVGDGPERKRLEALAGPTVEFLGWVDNDTLRDCYRGCRALLYPGEEDFGITAVEAQACGRPVIALGRGGALETVYGGTSGAVVGGRTGLFFEEASAEGLAAAMIESDSMRFSPADCRDRAERFSRDRFRRAMESEIFEKVERLL
jgi:glycosyltransferase involved in cell wall biosynthesis